jgi:hypothetical protein
MTYAERYPLIVEAIARLPHRTFLSGRLPTLMETRLLIMLPIAGGLLGCGTEYWAKPATSPAEFSQARERCDRWADDELRDCLRSLGWRPVGSSVPSGAPVSKSDQIPTPVEGSLEPE